MKQDDQDLLQNLLIEWFKENHPKDNRNAFNRTGVGIEIKNQLKKCGHWKNKPRGKINEDFLEEIKKKKENTPAKIINPAATQSQPIKLPTHCPCGEPLENSRGILRCSDDLSCKIIPSIYSKKIQIPLDKMKEYKNY